LRLRHEDPVELTSIATASRLGKHLSQAVFLKLLPICPEPA
jgi:hypothetical protein